MSDDGRDWVATFNWDQMRKVIAIADRAGCEPGTAIARGLGLLEVAVKAIEKGGRVVVFDVDGGETEIVGLIGEGETP